jgi:antirestriction protein ArdC
MKQDIYSRITNKIIADLEKGVRPWMKPWNAEHAAGNISRPLRQNGRPYTGINVLMLWMEAVDRGYNAPIWMTFRQAKELGGFVKKGEHGSAVVYASTFRKTEKDEKTGEEVERDIPFMKGYTVFNVEQIERLPAHYYAAAQAPVLTPEQRIEHAERFLSSTGAKVIHAGDRACYSPLKDQITMPPFEFFRDPESYYETLLHETVHWTRHPTRLDRDLRRKFDIIETAYAVEELIAELGSAYLCSDLGLVPEVRQDHASYIESWLKVLDNDRRAVFWAAAHAQKAADFLHGLQPAPEAKPEAGPEKKAVRRECEELVC